jgi:hypothetical protein
MLQILAPLEYAANSWIVVTSFEKHRLRVSFSESWIIYQFFLAMVLVDSNQLINTITKCVI